MLQWSLNTTVFCYRFMIYIDLHCIYMFSFSGYYCDTLGLTWPTDFCSAGFYCTLRSNTSTPTDDITGNVCPEGYYCEIGSSAPSPCPNGTYVNTTMASACIICPAGYYCVDRDDATICPQVSYHYFFSYNKAQD